MKTIGLNGKEYSLKMKDKHVLCSKLHSQARDLLYNLYPFDNIYEEVSLPGCKVFGKSLVADFFIPAQKLIIEVQGEQHYKFVQFFHGNKMELLHSKTRDLKKKEWCELNNFKLIELIYNETIDDWRNKLTG
jgi:hypothetical protein